MPPAASGWQAAVPVFKVRMAGMNAPELGRNGDPDQCWALKAKNWLRQSAQLRPGTTVHFELAQDTDQDQYHRLIRWIYTGDRNIDLAALAAGNGEHSTFRVPGEPHYIEMLAAEAYAQANHLGMWGACS